MLSFDVTQSPFFPVVLGVRWLSTHDPNITWSTRSIVFDSEYCRYHCRMYSPIPPSLPPPAQPSFYYPVDGYRVYQPVRYYYVQNVYTPVDENVYPDHRLVDPTIEMIPGAHSIPSGHVYSLSEPEMAALRDFVARNVKDGLITPTIAQRSPSSPGEKGVETASFLRLPSSQQLHHPESVSSTLYSKFG